MQTDILLLHPPFPTWSQLMPPLGLGYIGAYLQKKGYSVGLVDLALGNGTKILPKLKSTKPAVVCISGLTTQYEGSKEYAKLIKSYNKDVLIIMGGIHASAIPEYILKDCENIDIVVKGEGEYVLDWFLKTGSPVGIPGMYYKDNGTVIGEPPEPITDLDTLPSPWSFLPLEDYDGCSVNGILKPRGRQAVAILSSRGCPYKCSFCSASQAHGRKIRLRSVGNIISEIKELMSKGIREVQILDDNFTFYKEHACGVCEAMLDEGLDLVWTLPNGIRADRVDIEVLGMMKDAGCYYVGIGIESGSESVLKMVHKELSLESVAEAVNLTKELGIITQGFLLVGIPGETKEDLEETSEYVRSLPLDRISINQAMPYPGTELFEKHSSECGLTWNELHRTTLGGSLPKETIKFTRDLYLRFYLDPIRLARHTRKFKRFSQWASLVGGLQMLVSETRR